MIGMWPPVKGKMNEDPILIQEMVANDLDLHAMAVTRIFCRHLRYTKKSSFAQKEAQVHFAKYFLETTSLASLTDSLTCFNEAVHSMEPIRNRSKEGNKSGYVNLFHHCQHYTFL